MQGDFRTWDASFCKTCQFVKIYEKLAYSLSFVLYDHACNKVLQKFHFGANTGMSQHSLPLSRKRDFVTYDFRFDSTQDLFVHPSPGIESSEGSSKTGRILAPTIQRTRRQNLTYPTSTYPNSKLLVPAF